MPQILSTSAKGVFLEPSSTVHPHSASSHRLRYTTKSNLMAAMTTMMSTPAARMAPPARQGRTLRARATVTLTDKFVSTGIASRGAGAVTLPGSRVIVARASNDDRASNAIDAPARVHDATVVALEDAQDANIDGKQVRKIAVATAVFTAMVANCDIALAADAAAEIATSSGFWGLAPIVWLKSGWTGFTGLLASPEAKDIYVYTIKTLISWGVPAVTVGVVAFFIIGSSRRSKAASGDKPGGFSLFGGGKPGEKPSPFVIKRLNDRLDSYAYAFDQVTVGKDAVDAAKKRTAFADKYAAVLGKLTAKERDAVTAVAADVGEGGRTAPRGDGVALETHSKRRGPRGVRKEEG